MVMALGGAATERTINMIKISDHPMNLDRSAELVSSAREQLSIFRVHGGFVACLNGMAIATVFPTQETARAALSQFAGV